MNAKPTETANIMRALDSDLRPTLASAHLNSQVALFLLAVQRRQYSRLDKTKFPQVVKAMLAVIEVLEHWSQGHLDKNAAARAEAAEVAESAASAASAAIAEKSTDWSAQSAGWSAMSAAWSAQSAAWSADNPASAARSAERAVWSAVSAASAAWSAENEEIAGNAMSDARSAEYQWMVGKFISLLSTAT